MNREKNKQNAPEMPNLRNNKDEDSGNSPGIFSSNFIISYFLAFFILIVAMVLFYFLGVIFNVPLAGMNGANQMGANFPFVNQSIMQALQGNLGVGGPNVGSRFSIPINLTIWPIWGYFSLPNILQFTVFLVAGIIFIISVYLLYRHQKYTKYNKLWIITAIGIVLIILSNLIHGWTNGISGSIGEMGGLFSDAQDVGNIFQFISEYNDIQSTLGQHTRTHPPGAVATIYLLYVILRDPGLIAIAICIISTISSVYFFNGIFKHFFDKKLSKYMAFLYLLLPAIQIYYLANIYALITTLVLGVFYFYIHTNIKISLVGSIACTFLAMFLSFMAGFIILCLFIFEILRSHQINKIQNPRTIKQKLSVYIENCTKLLIISISILLIYSVLFITTRFNYLESFLTASSSESQGFAFASPLSYIITRVSDVLDILIFFGPVLIVLMYYGLRVLKMNKINNETSSTIYLFTISAIISLVLIFLMGAYDHGETARGAMFIYIFLLLPIAALLNEKKISRKEKYILLIIVFAQSILMQLFGFFIW